MADTKEKSEKKDPVKYKFGESELDLKSYITNLDHNVQRYMDSKNWNEGQREEFMDSYNQYLSALKEQLETNNNRFSADSFGNMSDSLGLLTDASDGDIADSTLDYYYNNNGERINTDQYNALKDKKKKDWNTFKSRREVANYFNTIGKALRDKTPAKPKEKEKFSIGKHGFISDWQKRNSASGERIDLTPYLDMDAFDKTTGKRARTNRIAYLQNEIKNYLENLNGDWDFEGTSFKDLNDYKAKLQILSDKLSDGWSSDDMIAANQAGIGASFYNDFFTEDENPNLSKEQKAEQERLEKEKAFEEGWRKQVQDEYDIYTKGQRQHSKERPYYFYLKNDYLDDAGQFSVTKWAESFNKDKNDPYARYILPQTDEGLRQYLGEVLKNPYNKELNRAMQYMIGRNIATKLEDGRYYIRREGDRARRSGLIYDPNNNSMYETFIGDITPEWNLIRQEYRNKYNPEGSVAQYYKEGGEMQKLQLGGGIDVGFENALKEELQTRATANNKSVEEQKADERKIGAIYPQADETGANPDASFTDVEYARIGGAVADIGAAIAAFVPGAGTATSLITGVSSTAANAYADFNDDGVSGGQAFKNLFINLGMDLAGLIPGGGFAAKGTKILKSVGKLLPKVALGLGALGAINNGEGIMNSVKKAISNPKDMDVQDWQNLAQALSLVSGASTVAGAAYGKKARANKQELANTIKQDKIALDVLQGDKKKTVIFTGDDAKNIRIARESNDIDAVNNILKKYEGTKDATVATSFSLGLKKPNKWYKPVNIGDTGKGNMAIHDIVNDATGAYIQRGNWTGDTRINSANMPEIYERQNQTVASVDKAVNKAQQDIIDRIKLGSEHRKNSIERLEKMGQKNQSQIDYFTKQINGRKSSDIQNQINDLHTRRGSDWNTRVQDYNDFVTSRNKAQKIINDNLKDPAANPLTDIQKQNLEKQIKDLDQKIAQEEIFIKANDDAVLNKMTQDYQKLQNLEKQLGSYKKRLSGVKKVQQNIKNKRTRQYEDFITTNTDPTSNKIFWDTPRGRKEMTKDEFDQILKDAGIYFKKGGTLNLNNVRKFYLGGKNYKNTMVFNGYNNSYDNNQENSSDYKVSFKKKVPELIDESMMLFSIPRAIMTNHYNNKMINEGLQDAKRHHTTNSVLNPERKEKSSLNDEIRGEKSAAAIRGMADRFGISDASKKAALMMESEVKAQDAINQGKATSDEIRRVSEEQAYQQQKENALNNKNTADYNSQSKLASLSKQSALEQTRISQEGNLKRTLGEEAQQRYDTKKTKELAIKEAAENQSILGEISDYVTKNLSTLDNSLSPEGVKLWQDYSSGLITSSDITADDNKYKLFNSVSSRIEDLVKDIYNHDYLGIERSPWYTVRKLSQTRKPNFSAELIETGKNGTKLAIANMKNAQKDNERFQKQVSETIKRHEKALERLFKSLKSTKK